MSTFPITWLVSVLMIFATYILALNTRVPGRARVFLCAFLLCLVFVTVLLGMRVSLDWLWPARAQPFVAILAAPTAYLGFAAQTVENSARWNRILLLNGGIVALALLGLAAPIQVSADAFILAINCLYIVRLAGLLSLRPDDFLSVPPHATGLWRAAMFATIALIGLMIVADGLVFAISLATSNPHLVTVLTGVSGLFTGFVFVVALIGAPLVLRASQGGAPDQVTPSDADHALMQTLTGIIKDKEPIPAHAAMPPYCLRHR